MNKNKNSLAIFENFKIRRIFDEEKEIGMGLPVGVMNDVAQQQLMSQVPNQPMNPVDAEHQMELQKREAQQNQTQEEKSPGTFVKLKQIL
jgi:hypothetical protein